MNDWLITMINFENTIRDVQCMMELCWKLFDVVTEIFESQREDGRMYDKPLYRYSTIASWAKQMWEKLLRRRLEDEWGSIDAAKKKDQYPCMPEDYETWQFIRQAAYGGRAQAFRKGVFEGPWEIIDVVSLYPFVMLFRSFPVGREQKTKEYVAGKLGVYRCRIHFQLENKPNVIPRRTEDAPLDWSYKGAMDVVLCNVDILDLWKHHGVASVAVYDGVFWPEHTDRLFGDYLTPLKTVKQAQDVYKKDRSKPYNPSLRAMAKLGSNSLSGKVTENMRRVINFITTGAKQRSNAENKYGTIRFRALNSRRGTFLATAYKSTTDLSEEYHDKGASPCQLGVFIYAYARSHMYNTVISRCGSRIGMDTDSLFLSREDVQTLKREHSDLFGSEYGQFDAELEEAYDKAGLTFDETKKQRFFMLAPKCYRIVDAETGTAVKTRFKGIGPNDRMLTKDSPMALLQHAHLQVVNGVLTSMERKADIALYKMHDFLESCEPAFTSNSHEHDLFHRLYRGETVAILSSRIEKQRYDKGDICVLANRVARKLINIH